MLVLNVLLVSYLGYLAGSRSADFPQPAMMKPAHCFMPADERASEHHHAMRHDVGPFVVALVGAFAPAIALAFAKTVVYVLSFVRPDIEQRNDGRDEINERDMRRKRLLWRLQSVECIICLACNATGIVFAWAVWRKAKPFLDPQSQEREWGFGQVVAVVLVAAPVLIFFEVLIGTCIESCCSFLPYPFAMDS
jgi:uncharacterized Tic20 family protein